ncbi:hypothetical protein KSP39_PZI020277 [Platanthera zijinensis]|uniref:Uncharacterized protein n=1 Tax=Platanthera zijinensis TaxID=2320716 RepID=A0AAP0FX35_9ASPA
MKKSTDRILILLQWYVMIQPTLRLNLLPLLQQMVFLANSQPQLRPPGGISASIIIVFFSQ